MKYWKRELYNQKIETLIPRQKIPESFEIKKLSEKQTREIYLFLKTNSSPISEMEVIFFPSEKLVGHYLKHNLTLGLYHREDLLGVLSTSLIEEQTVFRIDHWAFKKGFEDIESLWKMMIDYAIDFQKIDRFYFYDHQQSEYVFKSFLIPANPERLCRYGLLEEPTISALSTPLIGWEKVRESDLDDLRNFFPLVKKSFVERSISLGTLSFLCREGNQITDFIRIEYHRMYVIAIKKILRIGRVTDYYFRKAKIEKVLVHLLGLIEEIDYLEYYSQSDLSLKTVCIGADVYLHNFNF